MSAPQSDAFKQAVIDSKKLTAKPNNDELLELYGMIHTDSTPSLPVPSLGITKTARFLLPRPSAVWIRVGVSHYDSHLDPRSDLR